MHKVIFVASLEKENRLLELGFCDESHLLCLDRLVGMHPPLPLDPPLRPMRCQREELVQVLACRYRSAELLRLDQEASITKRDAMVTR